ncbi:hypothetical protein VNO77_08941 [Canavalia gladiata]|uniref:Uncharacterized protein n=1 Tax=Canavalia gladiata TaxID=3824 RepID=A0AAN9MAE3_CANGL
MIVFTGQRGWRCGIHFICINSHYSCWFHNVPYLSIRREAANDSISIDEDRQNCSVWVDSTRQVQRFGWVVDVATQGCIPCPSHKFQSLAENATHHSWFSRNITIWRKKATLEEESFKPGKKKQHLLKPVAGHGSDTSSCEKYREEKYQRPSTTPIEFSCKIHYQNQLPLAVPKEHACCEPQTPNG